MSAVHVVAPATHTASGLPLALLIAATATALVALAMIAMALYRSSRLNTFTGGLSAAAAVAVVACALLVGGALAPSPTAVADPVSGHSVTTAVHQPHGATDPSTGVRLDGPQLPTLGYDDPSATGQ